MTQPIHSGYLVLADLSGFTGFVARTEVDHAQGILSNLLGLMRRHLTPTLDLAEVEGDALFLHAPAHRIRRGETLLELIEETYAAFRDKLRTMERNASCPCEACRMIPSLDLKFVVHAGDWVMQDMIGPAKPFGSCVNLAHRLLKNDVTEATGWSAYALFTEEALAAMDVAPAGMHAHSLSYEHLGTCRVRAMDLHGRYEELTARRRDFIGQDEAHYTIRRSYGLAAPRLWELLTDAAVRNDWEVGAHWSILARPAGRQGPGATNHCAISNFIEEVLDWRPFEYYTVRLFFRSFRTRVTCELCPTEDGTDLRWSMVLESLRPRALRPLACRFFALRLMRAPRRFASLDRLVAGEAKAAPGLPD